MRRRADRALMGALLALTIGAMGCRAREVSSRGVAMDSATFVANNFTRGMAARVRWALSPDSMAIVVVEDPFGVESEPVPDGVLFASERSGRAWQMDSVWSAAPSPDWTRIAVGRAVVLRAGSEERVDPARWVDAARGLASIAGGSAALTADSLRAHRFPASGMSMAEGAAATFVADVGRDQGPAPIRFVALDGWRLRWSSDGASLFVGGAPARATDDGPSGSERRVAVSGVAGTGAAEEPRWESGPMLDIVTPFPDRPRRMVRRSRIIEGSGGRILIRSSEQAAVTDIGPGIPLASTRGGHFIVAVAPRLRRQPYESPDHVVVYRVP